MSIDRNEPRVSWRGMRVDDEAFPEPPSLEYPQRILLAVESSGNRKRLREHLEEKYELVVPGDQGLSEESFDLAVLDTGGLVRWYGAVEKAKAHEQPVFLPAMLILPRSDLGREFHPFGRLIDEFLVSPIDRRELDQRIGMLLRARRLALTQRAHLAHLVHHDRVTGLPSKTLFLDRLTQAVHDATILGQRVYVMVVQVPLVPILKSFGTRGQEEAASSWAARLKGVLGKEHSLSRLTTEQWGLMLRTGETVEDALEICRRIQALASTPLEADGERLHIAPRIGISVCPNDAANAEVLLDRALAALDHAQQKGAPAFYSHEVQERALRHLRTEARLHEALEREQLELWLQPKVSLRDGCLVGAEALVRWRLPSGELVSPGQFIPVAEASGLIRKVDRWMLSKACDLIQRWQAEDMEGLTRVAVNISAQHLESPDFMYSFEQALSCHGVPASALELELTETVLADLGPEYLARLNSLRDCGVNIALDDFGTGYCSLNYLHKLPITTLKIDKSFVDDITSNGTSAAITSTIIALAKHFELQVVAEGIETEAQAEYLANQDVQIGQGFLFARPMPEQEFRNWVAQRLP